MREKGTGLSFQLKSLPATDPAHSPHRCRKETLIMGFVHEINEITQRRRTGNSSKSADSMLKRKWNKLNTLLDEYAELEVMGTSDSKLCTPE